MLRMFSRVRRRTTYRKLAVKRLISKNSSNQHFYSDVKLDKFVMKLSYGVFKLSASTDVTYKKCL